MKIAALYARVSTPGQEKEETINSQLDEIESRAAKDGNQIGNNLRFIDEGWSGELLARPALDNLRDAIKNKTIEILYVYDLGRLSRNFLNQLILKNEIKEAGIELISLHDINASTPEQMFAQNIMGLFHEYERLKISERMRRGKLYKAKKGILFGWEAPYGYKYLKGKDDQKGNFVINDTEAKIIKDIFNWVGNEGLTIRQTIMRLYKERIYPRKSKNKYWSTSTLSRRLRDTTYIGTTFYNKTRSVAPETPQNPQKYKRQSKSSRKLKSQDKWLAIEVPAIISKELFDLTQKQLEKNQLFSKRNRKHNYLLSGLIHCTCGSTRAGEGSNGSGHFYYRCTDRIRRFPQPRECNNKGVNANVIDSRVWKEFTSLLTNPDLIERQYEKWVKKQSSQVTLPEEEVKRISKQLDNLKIQEKRYLTAYGEGVITLQQYTEQLNKIKLQRNIIEEKLQKAAPQESKIHITLPDLDEVCDKMSTVFTKLSFEKKRYIAKSLIDDVMTDARTATIRGYIPLEIPKNTENVKFQSINRNCRTPQYRKVDTL